MSLRSIRPLLASLVTLALVAGCLPDTDVIARVGRRPIRADDLLIVARQIGAGYGGPPDSAKTHLLEDLIRRELLVQGAVREGLHRDTTFLDYHRRVEEQLLRERLFAELGGSVIPVSDAEVMTLHRWRAQETRARVIFTYTREAADAALDQVGGGAAFGVVADRFNPRGFTPPGGDLGFVPPGLLLPPLDDLLRTAAPGRVIGPIEAAAQGWFVIRVEERRPRQAAPLEAERNLLTEVIRQRKQRQLMLRALERLTAAYEVQVTRGAAQELVGRLLPAELQGLIPALADGDRAVVLAEYRGGVYTLGDAVGDLQTGGNRPDLRQLPTVERWLLARAHDRAMLLEARARQYMSEPASERALRQRMNDFLLEGYLARRVLAPVQATEADARALYEGDPHGIVQLREARVLHVTLRDSAVAAQLALNARQAEGLREAVATAALGARVRSETLRFPTAHPIWRPLEPQLRSLLPGGYAGPLAAPAGWIVLQLVSKTEAPEPYDQLPPQTKQALLHDATELKRSDRLARLTASLRSEIPVTIDWKRLKRLEWPQVVPALLGGAEG